MFAFNNMHVAKFVLIRGMI